EGAATGRARASGFRFGMTPPRPPDNKRSGSTRSGSTRLDVPVSFRAFFRVPDIVSQRLQLLVDRAGGVAFDLAIAGDQRHSERGEDCAAAVLAAGLPRDRRLPA